MSTTPASKTNPAPERGEADRPRAQIATRVRLSILVLAIFGIVTGAFVVLGWMVDETHFNRSSPEFDELATQVEHLPGVHGVDTERWVEAPTFADPTSWISVTVDQAALPDLLETACSTDYPDAVSWSLHVRTHAAAEVSLHADPTTPNTTDRDGRCPDFGLDAVRLVDELDRVAPGLAVQPALWESGRLALVALEEGTPTGFAHVLPLIEHADALLAAAEVTGSDAVEINSADLSFILEPGESDRYLALLTELAADHGVSAYWADGGDAPIDGVEKVQIVAPADQHAAIEDLIRSSRLPVADLPMQFVDR